MNYGQLIKRTREQKGIKAIFVARKLKLSAGRYSELEAGRTKLTVERAQKIADILGTTLPVLLCPEVSETLTDTNPTGTDG